VVMPLFGSASFDFIFQRTRDLANTAAFKDAQNQRRKVERCSLNRRITSDFVDCGCAAFSSFVSSSSFLPQLKISND
jgi:hypothetical protein